MVPYVSIVGKSGSGKTTLIERLITEFRKRGYRVAAVKHSPEHKLEGIELDEPGKDSWRFAQAGSDAVLLSSPGELMFIKNVDGDSSIEEILRIIGGDFDLVLIEGFKTGKAPKIEVHRKELGEHFVCPTEALSAIVSNEPLSIDKPQLPLDDTSAIADFIEKNFVFQIKGDASIFVNGKQIPIGHFVENIITRTAMALVSTLKGVEKVRSLDISIRNKFDSTTTMSDSERSLPQAAQEDSSLRSE